MFAKFWQHYPQGSLTSTLVTVDRGMYIVRALVQVNNQPIASGLGAAGTVEAAEDQARARALAVLELETTPAVATPPPPELTPTPPTVEPSPGVADNGATSLPSSPPQATTTAPPPEPPTAVTQPEVSPEPTATTTLPLETSEEVTAAASTPEPDPETEPVPTPSANPASPPIDFSDVIARTNVELKRLNWTTEQGKDYLLQTYGKRSRQLLTDEELLEFLQYLETLPNP